MRILLETIWPPDKRITVEALTANVPAIEFWKSCGFGEYAVTFSREVASERHGG